MNATKLNELYAIYRNDPATEDQFFSAVSDFLFTRARIEQAPDDIAQLTLIEVYHSIRTFRGESTFATWVGRLYKRTLWRFYQDEVDRQRMDDAVDELSVDFEEPLMLDDYDLSDRERQIVEWLLQGYTQKQIARKLNVSQPVVCLTIKSLRDAIKSA